MAPSISVNTLSLVPGSLDTYAATVAELGVSAIFPEVGDIDTYGVIRAAQLVRDTGLRVGGVTHRAFGFATAGEARTLRERLSRSIELASAVGASTVCMTTGGRGALSWREAP